MSEEKKVLPSVVFEGPLGKFWPIKEVPTEAIVLAIRELMDELHRRGGLEMARIELEGKITCIHHSTLGKEMAPGLNINMKTREQEKLSYSIIDVKVGRREMRVIRPMTKRFEWQHDKGEEVRSGDTIRIVIEARRRQ